MFSAKLPPRHVRRNAASACPLFCLLKERAIPGLGPRLDGALIERFARVRHDQIQIEVDRVSETLAARTSSVGIVERKKPGLRLLVERTVILAFESLVERQPLGSVSRAIRNKFQKGFALPFAITNFDRIHQPRARLCIYRQPVHKHIDGLGEVHPARELPQPFSRCVSKPPCSQALRFETDATRKTAAPAPATRCAWQFRPGCPFEPRLRTSRRTSARTAQKATAGNRKSPSLWPPSSADSAWNSSAGSPLPARCRKFHPHPAFPCAPGTALRRPIATPRSAAALPHRWCRTRARIFPIR